MASLDVDTAGLGDAGSSIRGRSQAATAPTWDVAAPARDPASVRAAHQFAGRIAAISARTTALNSATSAAGALTQSSAAAYATQEAAGAAALHMDGQPRGSVSPPLTMNSPDVSAPAVAAPPGGIPPARGREIAELVHGGPGEGSLISAAARLSRHADELATAADGLRSDSSAMAGAWRSQAADQAEARITDLVSRYAANSDAAKRLSTVVGDQADAFAELRRAVPTVAQFDDTERQLQAASQAARVNPMYAPAVAKLSGDLADLNRRAIDAYSRYTARTGENISRGNGIQLLDTPLRPPFPLKPPKDYPVNEIIAEATDLDGNRVILRRGYYDGKRGFGWDKVFHKHNITNPNVFTDLISHSRPISKKDGELIYQVPINRTHCEAKLGGLYTSCTDTGENLLMTIVVDTTENRGDVPDGRQKGVITMYPEPGGSGVVEVAPGWTMAPPWVSQNVPIN